MTDATKAILIKILAIIGFAVTIALILWLIIYAVARTPQAFESLATIADSVNIRKEISALEVTLEKTVVNSGERFTIEWTDTRAAGTYRLGYACEDMIRIFFQDPQGTFRPIRCGEPLPLPDSILSLTLTASSSVKRFADVTFTVAFQESENHTPIEGTAKVTVVNAAIPVGATSTPSTSDDMSTATPETVEPTTATTTPVAKPPVTRPPQQPITTVVYPTSDPNGYTDLAVVALESGTMRNGVFVLDNDLNRNGAMAIRFTVKNLGTKTSRDWSFNADLPGSASDYTSQQYAGLKPKEYMTFSMGFGALDLQTRDRITYSVLVTGDTNAGNNSTSITVR